MRSRAMAPRVCALVTVDRGRPQRFRSVPYLPRRPDRIDRRRGPRTRIRGRFASSGPLPIGGSEPLMTWREDRCRRSRQHPSSRGLTARIGSSTRPRRGQGVRGLRGHARAAHEPPVHGRRPPAANDRHHQPSPRRRQVDDRLQSRSDARRGGAPSCSSTATSVGRWSPRRWGCRAARVSATFSPGGRPSVMCCSARPSKNLFVLAAGASPRIPVRCSARNACGP